MAFLLISKYNVITFLFRKTLDLAIQLNDRVVEAQACYSLGNTYTLLRDYKKAIEYHLRHMKIAQELRDRIGEGRACWSLGNALTAVGDHQEALSYAQKHLDISKEIGDITGQTTAQMSITDLRRLIENDPKAKSTLAIAKTPERQRKRMSMEKMELVKMTPEQRKTALKTVEEGSGNSEEEMTYKISKSHEDFLDLLIKYQSKRMDDQRCALQSIENKENRKPNEAQRNVPRMGVASHPRNPVRSLSHDAVTTQVCGFSNTRNNQTNQNNIPNVSNNTPRNNNANNTQNHIGNAEISRRNEQHRDELFDLIAGMQERRMDDQRANLPPIRRNSATNGPESLPGQHHRIVNFVPNHNNNIPHLRTANRHTHASRQMSLGANVLPDDDFFEMLMRCQSSRLEDQRALIPSTSNDDSRPERPNSLERPLSASQSRDNSPNEVSSIFK